MMRYAQSDALCFMFSRVPSSLATTLACGCALACAAPAQALVLPSKYTTAGGSARAAALPSATAAPGTRVYAGSTTHGELPLVIEVRKNRVTRVIAQYQGACFAYGHDGKGSALTGTAVSGAGRATVKVTSKIGASSTIFRGGGAPIDAVVEQLKVTFGKKTATGTIRATAIRSDGSRCQSDVEPFRLTHEQGRYFGGVTTQHMPVVLELQSSRAEVHHLHMGWYAQCQDGSYNVVPDFLVAFPIVSGVWGDVFTQTFATPTLNYTVAYDIHGTVGASKGTGRFSVEVKGADAAAVVQDDCSTGSVKFSVAS